MKNTDPSRTKYYRLFRRLCRFFIYACFAVLYIYYFTREVIKWRNGPDTKDICLVPSIEVDTALLRYVNHTLEPLKCRHGIPPFIRQRDKKISKILFKYLNTTHFNCCYSLITRRKTGLYTNKFCKPFDRETEIKAEFIKVTCSYNQIVQYEDYFAFAPRNKFQLQNKTALKRFNVLLLGIRSLSRVNAYRKIVKFTNYLRYNLVAAEFSKFNAINIDGDFIKNIIPMYTGLNAANSLAMCSGEKRKNCSWIWDRFAEEGYKIILGEDCPSTGVFTNEIFKDISPDYSLLPFMDLYEKSTGNIPNGDCYICTSSRKAFKVVLDYYSTIAQAMRDKNEKHFAMLWINSLTKTDDPYRGLNALEIAGQELKGYFNSLNWKGLIEDTMVIVFSDRGYISRKLYFVKQLRQEAKQPLLFILPPKLMRKQKPAMVNKLFNNRNKLITAFDIHQTLEAVMQLNTDTLVHPPKGNSTEGLSLLNTVPHRLCENVGIKRTSCACKYIAKYDNTKSKKKTS